MDQFLTWQILEISSTLINSEQRKMHQSRIRLSINLHKQQASVTSSKQGHLERQIMTSKSSISTTLPSNHVASSVNILWNRSKRKRWSEQNSQMNKAWKKERFISIQCSQTNSIKVCIISQERYTTIRKMQNVQSTSRSSRTISSRKWTRSNGQDTWQKSFTACGSILSQQLYRCISLTPQSWFSSRENCFSIS